MPLIEAGVDEGVVAEDEGREHARHGGAVEKAGGKSGGGRALFFVAGNHPCQGSDHDRNDDAHEESPRMRATRGDSCRGWACSRGCCLRRRRRCS